MSITSIEECETKKTDAHRCTQMHTKQMHTSNAWGPLCVLLLSRKPPSATEAKTHASVGRQCGPQVTRVSI